jgi:hypothetical protein
VGNGFGVRGFLISGVGLRGHTHGSLDFFVEFGVLCRRLRISSLASVTLLPSIWFGLCNLGWRTFFMPFSESIEKGGNERDLLGLTMCNLSESSCAADCKSKPRSAS